jgi:hypothetical protein
LKARCEVGFGEKKGKKERRGKDGFSSESRYFLKKNVSESRNFQERTDVTKFSRKNVNETEGSFFFHLVKMEKKKKEKKKTTTGGLLRYLLEASHNRGLSVPNPLRSSYDSRDRLFESQRGSDVLWQREDGDCRPQ